MIKIGDLSPNWEIKHFLDCIIKATSPTKLKVKKKDYKEKGKFAIVDQSTDYIAGYTDDAGKVFKEDLPIIIFGDHTRIFKFIDFPFALGADGAKILIPNKDIIDAKYFYYFLKGLTIDDHGYSRHFKYLKENKIIVPPLETQHKIVEILDKAEKLKEYRINARDLTNDYLKSLFFSTFLNKLSYVKWECKSLVDVCEINPKKSEVKNLANNKKITFLPMEVIGENGEIYKQEIKCLSDVYKGYTYFRRNDVLFAKITPCMENGKGAIAKISTDIGFGSTEFHILRPKDEVTSEWIYYLLSLDFIRKFAENMMTGSAGQKRVPKSFFNKLKVPIPPLELQNQFADNVQRVTTLKEYQEESKLFIDDFFNVLMQKAFKGELVC